MIDKITHADKADYAIGVGAVSVPLWLELVKPLVTEYIFYAGAFLITIRIGLALREWWRGRKPQ